MPVLHATGIGMALPIVAMIAAIPISACVSTMPPASPAAQAGSSITYRDIGGIANDASTANRYFAIRRYAEALELYAKLDATGDRLSRMPMIRGAGGYCYISGLAVSAALDEIAAARESIGEHFEDGTGMPKNYQVAAYWYQKSVDTRGADFGRQLAAMNLAYMYLNGKGVPQDRMKARALLAGVGGGMGEKYAKMFDNNLLPWKVEDLDGRAIRAAMQKLDDQQTARILAIVAIMLSSGSSSPHRSPEQNQPTRGECSILARGSVSVASMNECPPWGASP